jgi:6-pyruvoyltetrahydropterin/6-carboxytetrahydropterin synthase
VRTHFSAAHRLCRPGLSDAANFALYGKCSNPNSHGHNYDLEVAVAGEIDSETGMVVNFYELTEAVEREIVSRVDHKHLNMDVDFLEGHVPTAENMARLFWDRLEPHVRGGRLHSITIGERDVNIVTYYGPRAVLAAREQE